jgi:hypothetical protein
MPGDPRGTTADTTMTATHHGDGTATTKGRGSHPSPRLSLSSPPPCCPRECPGMSSSSPRSSGDNTVHGRRRMMTRR